MTDLDLPRDVVESIFSFMDNADVRKFLLIKQFRDIAREYLCRTNIVHVQHISMNPYNTIQYKYILTFFNHWVLTSNEDYKKNFENINIFHYRMSHNEFRFNLKVLTANVCYLMYVYNIHNGNHIPFMYPIYKDSYFYTVFFNGLQQERTNFFCLKTPEIYNIVMKMLPRSVRHIIDIDSFSDYYAIYLVEYSGTI